MGWRMDLENKYTVTCKRCRSEQIDPNKHPRRKWIKKGECDLCNFFKPIHYRGCLITPSSEGGVSSFISYSNGDATRHLKADNLEDIKTIIDKNLVPNSVKFSKED